MATKLFSEKFLEKNEEIIKNNIGEIMGLDEARIVRWKIGKEFGKDVRTVFDQTPEEDKVIKDFFEGHWKNSKERWKQIKYVVKGVNGRLTYKKDIDQFNAEEYWAKPIQTFWLKQDDCDGFANLAVKALRLFGCSPYEVFTAVGNVYLSGVKIGLHAYPIILDWDSLLYFPLEGSFSARNCMIEYEAKKYPINGHPRYGKPRFIFNDVHSFSTGGWFGYKFVR